MPLILRPKRTIKTPKKFGDGLDQSSEVKITEPPPPPPPPPAAPSPIQQRALTYLKTQKEAQASAPKKQRLSDASSADDPPSSSTSVEMPPAPPPIILHKASKKRFHCFLCQRLFVSKQDLTRHQQKNCEVSICSQDHVHQVISFDFETLEKAFDWIKAQELDQYYAPLEVRLEVRKYSCIFNERIISNHDNNPIKEISPYGNCESFVNILQTNKCDCTEDDIGEDLCGHVKSTFWVQGCLSHCHPFDPVNRRISHLTNSHLLTQLRLGADKNRLLAECKAVQDTKFENRRAVTMEQIVRIRKALDEEQAAGKIVYVRAKVAQENVSGSEKQTNASETGSEQKTAQSEASTSEVTAQPTKLIKVRVVPANKRLDPDAAFGDDFFTVKHLEQVVKNNRLNKKQVMKKKAPPPKEKEAPKFYHCMDCRKILRSMVCLKDHVNADMCSRQPHTCLENHEHENLEYYFESLELGLDWYRTEELDQFYVVYMTRPNFKSFRCIRNARPSKYVGPKKDVNCTSFITLRKTERCFCPPETEGHVCVNRVETFMVTGCLKHTHELDKKKVRLSNMTKTYILNLLQQGHDIKQTLAICHNEWLKENPNRKPIAYIDVKNVYDAYVLNKKTPTRKEREERRRAKLQKGQSKGEEQEQRPSPDPSEADEHQEAGEQEDLLETAEAVQQVVIQEDNVIPNEIPVQPVVSEASYVFQTDAVNNELYQQQQQQLPQQQHQDYNTETPVEYVSQGADPTYTISVPTAQPTSEYTTVNGSPLKQHPVAAYTIAATDVPTTELQVPPVTHQVPAVPEAGGPLLLSSQRKTYMTPEQRRIGILKKLQEMTTFLKSSSPDDLKSELMDSLETKPVTNVIIPSVKIKMIKNCSYDSDLPARKAREKRARKKREKEEAARLAAAATAEAVAGLEELQSQGVKPTR